MKETTIVRRMISAILKGGATIDVNDGTETTVKRSTDRNQIWEALRSTGEDYLIARDENGKRLGWFWLIWNNGGGEEVLTDYSANEYSDGIVNVALPGGS